MKRRSLFKALGGLLAFGAAPALGKPDTQKPIIEGWELQDDGEYLKPGDILTVGYDGVTVQGPHLTVHNMGEKPVTINGVTIIEPGESVVL